MHSPKISDAYPLWVFDLSHEMYKDQFLGVLSLLEVAKGFVARIRTGEAAPSQLKAFINMLLRHPKSGNARKILRHVLPELQVKITDKFDYKSWQHRYFVECMRPDMDDPLPVDDIPIAYEKVISPAGRTLSEEINAQLWQAIYQEAMREEAESTDMKGKDREGNLSETAKSPVTDNEEDWGEEAMLRVKNLAIILLNEEDVALGIARRGERAWSQAGKEKTEEERQEEIMTTKLKQLTSPLMKAETAMRQEMPRKNYVKKAGFRSREKRLGSSLNMEDKEELDDRFLTGLEIEEKAQTTKGKKGMKSANKRQRR